MYRNLKAEMIRAGIKTADLAKVIGKTTGTVYNKLNGKTGWYHPEVMTIKEILEQKNGTSYTLDYLMEEDGK